jgi:hypothetical protein
MLKSVKELANNVFYLHFWANKTHLDMKRVLLLSLLVASSYYAQSQTKGTNAIGLGISLQTKKSEGDYDLYNPDRKLQSYSLIYGRFAKDNVRIGLSANYLYAKDSYSTFTSLTEGYGGNAHYQKYFPLLKKFYAFASGNAGYQYTSVTNRGSNDSDNNTHQVSLEANGGAAYFLSKRFLLEANLLSAGVSYGRSTTEQGDGKVKDASFNMSSSGSINGLGFKIYFLF